jgi:hypothetical protein
VCDGCNTNISIRILSPGNDGPVTQTNSTSMSSIVSQINSTVQNVVQAIVPPAQPGADELQLPELPQLPQLPVMPELPSFDMPDLAIPTQMLLPVLQILPVLPAVNGQPLDSRPRAVTQPAPPAATQPAQTAQAAPQAPVGPTPTDSGTAERIAALEALVAELIAGSDDTGAISPVVAPIRPDSRSRPPARRQDGEQPTATAAAGGTQLGIPGFWQPASARTGAPLAGQAATQHGAATSARDAKRGADPARLPLPRAPFAPGTDLSVASTAPGSGSAGTGVAILVGALLLVAPSVARWLRAAQAPRPRAPFLRRPERPG